MSGLVLKSFENQLAYYGVFLFLLKDFSPLGFFSEYTRRFCFPGLLLDLLLLL